VEFTLVKSQLLPLKNIPITPTRLTRPARDDGIQSTSLKLLLERRINLSASSKPSSLLTLNRFAFLHLFFRLSILGSLGLLASTTERLAIVCLIPLTERGGVNLNNSRFRESVGTDELVIGRVVSDDNDTRLAGATL
jgi:hypothetical protein